MAIRATTETKLLDAADALFFSAGIGATPIDAVLEKAGVSAATLYRGYPSKEALVAAALERRQLAWLDVWDAAIERAASPRDRVLAVFDALESFRLRADGARWCAFLGSAAEYADPPEEIARAVARDTAALRDRLRDLAEPLVGSRAAALAEELLLIVSGDLAMRLRGPDSDTTVARAIADTILQAHERAGTADA
ncbi:TetR/AcrR family transcriptional regulator [Planctomonas psychrotolerans]|uniref:TetR/AcrR family transcriptional regulator n=1 Tax=Planctomonas psychrotolerans TaxID=2528712 RepID=UPI00123A7014|nr:TetR/AcrR family transcriptional regulator [Planctomonas psychrotolerans]